MAKEKTPKKNVPDGLKLSLEGSPLELRVAFAAITTRGLQYGGSLAASKKNEVSFSEFCAQPLPLTPEEVEEGKKPKPCCGKLHTLTICTRHPKATHQTVMKGYDTGGGEFVFLTEEQVEKFKVQGEAAIHITPLDMRVPCIPDAMQRLFSGARYLVPVDAEDADTAMRFEALRAFLGNRCAVARILWRRTFSYALILPAEAGGFFVHPVSSLGRAYEVVTVPLGRYLTPEQGKVIEQRGAEAARGRVWSDELVRDNPFTEALKSAILAVLEGKDADAVETPDAPKREVDILAIV